MPWAESLSLLGDMKVKGGAVASSGAKARPKESLTTRVFKVWLRRSARGWCGDTGP